MSTQIKKNGNWVTVAGGTRMWVGTKAALQAALDAGELVDGTAVMVTDDYDEAQPLRTYAMPVNTSIPGITITKRDNNPKGLFAVRNGNSIILYFSVTVAGTLTGEASWYDLFDWNDMLSHMLDDGEEIADGGCPYFCTNLVDYAHTQINLDGVMSGRSIFLYQGVTFNNFIGGQIILTVSRT